MPPVAGIPTYNADTDPYCPRAQVRKYNEDRKKVAKLNAKKGKGSAGAAWVTKTLQTKFENVPLLLTPSLRSKAMSNIVGNRTPAEVETLQKVIVRENILMELHRLLDHNDDISGVLAEVGELVKALRFQTVDLVEDIDAWMCVQPSHRPFLYRGVNYLTKIAYDLDFLDQYEEIVEKFCFEFKRNPFGYRDGGEVILGSCANKIQATDNFSQRSNYLQKNAFVNGVELIRIRNAEKVIQNEFNRIDKEKGYFEINKKAINDAEEDMIKNNITTLTVPSLHEPSKSSMKSSNGSKKGIVKFNARKIKLERIATLQEEAGDLKGMETHLEEQVNILVDQYQSLSEKRKSYDTKRKEALSLDRDVAAQHIAVEISIMTADMQEINGKIKEIQKQGYFIALERRRKRQVARQLNDEVESEKARLSLKNRLSAQIKAGGLQAALKTLNNLNVNEMNNKQSKRPQPKISESDLFNMIKANGGIFSDAPISSTDTTSVGSEGSIVDPNVGNIDFDEGEQLDNLDIEDDNEDDLDMGDTTNYDEDNNGYNDGNEYGVNIIQHNVNEYNEQEKIDGEIEQENEEQYFERQEVDEIEQEVDEQEQEEEEENNISVILPNIITPSNGNSFDYDPNMVTISDGNILSGYEDIYFPPIVNELESLEKTNENINEIIMDDINQNSIDDNNDFIENTSNININDNLDEI